MNLRGATPAFPAEGCPGITLRDYVAVAALQGILATDTYAHDSDSDQRLAARDAYSLADAMLAARVL
jgi:hypothetical protein